MQGRIVVSRFLTRMFSFGFAKGMLVFPFILLAERRYRNDPVLLNHERIHYRQAVELLVLGFYVLYLAEFIVRWIQSGGNWQQAYYDISFEREAYSHERDLAYLAKRKPWAFRAYFRNK